MIAIIAHGEVCSRSKETRTQGSAPRSWKFPIERRVRLRSAKLGALTRQHLPFSFLIATMGPPVSCRRPQRFISEHGRLANFQPRQRCFCKLTRGNVQHELTTLPVIRRDRIKRSMEVEQLDQSPASVEHTSPGQQSDSKAQRYQCPDCDKSYRAKETLNRHRKNHSRHVDHVCHVCHVGFRRKDLLLRHYKIHRGDENTSGHFKDRQRSRQACDRCSKLKTKVGAALDPASAEQQDSLIRMFGIVRFQLPMLCLCARGTQLHL